MIKNGPTINQTHRENRNSTNEILQRRAENHLVQVIAGHANRLCDMMKAPVTDERKMDFVHDFYLKSRDKYDSSLWFTKKMSKEIHNAISRQLFNAETSGDVLEAAPDSFVDPTAQEDFSMVLQEKEREWSEDMQEYWNILTKRQQLLLTLLYDLVPFDHFDVADWESLVGEENIDVIKEEKPCTIKKVMHLTSLTQNQIYSIKDRALRSLRRQAPLIQRDDYLSETKTPTDLEQFYPGQSYFDRKNGFPRNYRGLKKYSYAIKEKCKNHITIFCELDHMIEQSKRIMQTGKNTYEQMHELLKQLLEKHVPSDHQDWVKKNIENKLHYNGELSYIWYEILTGKKSELTKYAEKTHAFLESIPYRKNPSSYIQTDFFEQKKAFPFVEQYLDEGEALLKQPNLPLREVFNFSFYGSESQEQMIMQDCITIMASILQGKVMPVTKQENKESTLFSITRKDLLYQLRSPNNASGL